MSSHKRTAGSPVPRSLRLALRECGIAYRPRGPGRRSRRSTPRTGKPFTGERAAGEGMPRAERCARCVEPTLSWVSSETAEPRHNSLESGVMRKYHAPLGGRPTEKDYPVVPRRRPPLPHSRWCNRIPTATTPKSGAVRNRLIDFLDLQPLPDGRWKTIPSQGMSRTPTSHSIRSTRTEHEIAYRGRPPRRRSSRSSPRQGEPATWRRGIGDLTARTER